MIISKNKCLSTTNTHKQKKKKSELNNIVITERKINEIINVLIQSQVKFLAKLFQLVTVRQLNRRSTVLFEHIDDFLKHKRKKTSNKLHEEASSLGVR